MSIRHEVYMTDADGKVHVEVLSEDTRTITVARRERIAMVWSRAREVMTDRLINRGYDPITAERLAITMIFEQLPLDERTAVASIASAIVTRSLRSIQSINAAITNDDVDRISPD